MSEATPLTAQHITMEATSDELRRMYLFGFTGAGKSSLISTLRTAASAPPVALIEGVALTRDPATMSMRSFDVEVRCNGETKPVAHVVDTRGWNDGTTAEAMLGEINQYVTGGEERFLWRTEDKRVACTLKRRVAQRNANANCIIIVGSPLLTEKQLREYRGLKDMLERAGLGYITGWVLTGPRKEGQPEGECLGPRKEGNLDPNFLGIVAPVNDRFVRINNYVPLGEGVEVPIDEALDRKALVLLERVVRSWANPNVEVKNTVLALWETAVNNLPTVEVTTALWSTLSLGNLVNLFVLFVVVWIVKNSSASEILRK
eukprot:m51a1_g3912 putative C-tail anchored protein (317) ;mRNA; f:137641-138833